MLKLFWHNYLTPTIAKPCSHLHSVGIHPVAIYPVAIYPVAM